jgi:hypothetical protein
MAKPGYSLKGIAARVSAFNTLLYENILIAIAVMITSIKHSLCASIGLIPVDMFIYFVFIIICIDSRAEGK